MSYMEGKYFNVHIDGDKAIITIDGDIGADWLGGGDNTKAAISAQLAEVANLQASEVVVNINSYGGDVNHGLSIHDALQLSTANITTDITGMTASAATIIAQGASRGNRRMSSNALFLIHHSMTVGMGNANELKAEIKALETIDGRMLDIYDKAAKRSGTSNRAELRELMSRNNGNGEWITARQALKYGLIDTVYEPARATAYASPQTLKNAGLPPIPAQFRANISNNLQMNFNEPFKGILAKLGFKGTTVEEVNKEAEAIDFKAVAGKLFATESETITADFTAKLSDLEGQFKAFAADAKERIENQGEEIKTAKEQVTALETAKKELADKYANLVTASAKTVATGELPNTKKVEGDWRDAWFSKPEKNDK